VYGELGELGHFVIRNFLFCTVEHLMHLRNDHDECVQTCLNTILI